MKIYITFDYELFLGPETGSVDACLLKPTYELLNIAKRNNVSFVFFVDTLYLLKMKEFANDSYSLRKGYMSIMEQLNVLHQNGQDLQLHLHPQWYYSSYDLLNEKWLMDYKHYKLSDCDEYDISMMIEKSCHLLQEITGKVPVSYRAGGYSFYRNKNVVDIFNKNGIIIDSSVVLKEKSETLFQSYDYSSVTKSNVFYFDFDNRCYTPDGIMKEYPIFSVKVLHILRIIVNKTLSFIYGHKLKPFGDGEGVGVINSPHNKNCFKTIFERVSIRASADANNSFWLSILYSIAKRRNSEIFVIIGHPKRQSPYSMTKLEDFLKRKRKEDVICNFKV